MPFEIFVALRYLREARFQTGLILAAVAVGVGVVVFLSALINGLQDNLIATTLGSQPHVIVSHTEAPPRVSPAPGAAVAALVEQPPVRERILNNWPEIVRDLSSLPNLMATAAVVSGPAIVTRGEATLEVALRGIVLKDYNQIVPIASKLRAGRFALGSEEALIGTELAGSLGIGVGDKLHIETIHRRSATLRVAGIFDLGSKDVNKRWVLTNMRLAQSLLASPGGVTSLELRLANVFAAEETAREITARTGLKAESWIQLNKLLMAGLRSQSSSRYIIEFFVIVAVALGIASVLLVAVVQKSKEIGIMRAFGASDRQMIGIFLFQGAVLGSAGSLGGSLLGGLLAHFFRSFSHTTEGLPMFPTDVTPGLLAGTSLMAIAVGVAAAAFPAWRATQLDPAAVIRYG